MYFKCMALALVQAMGVGSAWAQSGTSLDTLFEAAWARQPEAASAPARERAAAARQAAAHSWLADGPALEALTKTDRWHRNDGSRELDVAVALPLWLPGERDRSQRLAQAEAEQQQWRTQAARLRVAQMVRDAWWQGQRARVAVELADSRSRNAQQLAADVLRRVKAGDLARADQVQADGAVAAARAAQADANGVRAAAVQQMVALAGREAGEGDGAEVLPVEAAVPLDRHPAVQALRTQADAARRAAELALARRRGNPELTVGATHERSGRGETAAQALTVGVRIPLGSSSRYEAQWTQAQAEADEAEAQWRVERDRVQADVRTAQARYHAAQAQREAAQTRARLALEARGFFQKSFALGESDLPTRLRIEQEAVEAERQAALARIDEAAAISALRQALGLLPAQ